MPYWDWAEDGQLPAAQQPKSPLWASTGIGGSGDPITTGPFVFKPADPSSFRVRVDTDSNGNMRQVNRGLARTLAQDVNTLPNKAATASVLTSNTYDAAPWTVTSTSFRNHLEGWKPPLGLHNRVHVWIGGDMSPASSPNDPVFFLNHCNVDRIWEAWMKKHGRVYVPGDKESDDLKGHRLHDQLSSLISGTTTPAAVLDSTAQFVYDSLNV